jgi:hypothetical protein
MLFEKADSKKQKNSQFIENLITAKLELVYTKM